LIKRVTIFSFIFLVIVSIISTVVFESVFLKNFLKRLIVSKAYYNYSSVLDLKELKISYFSPSIILKSVSFKKESENFDLEITSSKAKVSFNLFNVLRGNYFPSKYKLENPKIKINLKKYDFEANSFDKNLYKKLLSYKELLALELENTAIKVFLNNKLKLSIEKSDLSFEYVIFGAYLANIDIKQINFPKNIVDRVKSKLNFARNGLRIRNLDIKYLNNNINLKGYLDGVTDLKSSKLNLFWETNIDLEKVSENFYFKKYLNKNKNFKNLKGSLHSKGEVNFNNLHNFSISRSLGTLNLADFKHDIYDIKKINLVYRYKDRKLFLDDFKIFENKNKSVSFHESKILFKKPYDIKGKGRVNDIELSKYLEMFDINNCPSNFNINGDFEFEGNHGENIEVVSLFDLKVDDFWLLKSKGLKISKENSILNFKKGSIYGFFRFSEKGAYFDKITANDGLNKYIVEGWIRDDASVDLNIQSDHFSFKNIKRISDIRFKGDGNFSVDLRIDDKGDVEVLGFLDFNDLDLMNSYKLGKVYSNVYYNKKGVLKFNQFKGKIGHSNYKGYLNFDLNKSLYDVFGNVDFNNFYSSDIYSLLKVKDDFSIQPSGLVSGNIKFKGPPLWSKIFIDLNLKSQDINILNESFEKGFCNLSWQAGDIDINKLELLKVDSKIVFKGKRKDGVLDVNFNSKNLKISDLNNFPREYYLRGNVDLKGNIYIKDDVYETNSELSFFDLFLENKKIKNISAKLKQKNNHWNLSFDIFDKQILGDIKKTEDGFYSLNSDVNNLNLYPLFSAINPGAEKLETNINAKLFLVLNKYYDIKNFNINLDQIVFKNQKGILKSSKLLLKKENEGVNINEFKINTESNIGSCLLRVNKNNNATFIKGCIDIFWLKFLFTSIESSSGILDFDLNYNNFLNGKIGFNNLNLLTTLNQIGNVIPEGNLIINKDKAYFDDLTIYNNKNSDINFKGFVDFNKVINLSSLYPEFNLKVDFTDFYLNLFEGLKGSWTGVLSLEGETKPYQLSGETTLKDGFYGKFFEFSKLNKLRSNKNLSLDREILNIKKINLLNLDIKVQNRENVLIRNDVLKGELVFNLNLLGTELDPYFVGSINLNNTRVDYLGHAFEPTTGDLNFKSKDNYSYNFNSETKIDRYNIYLNIFGDDKKNKIKLDSTPVLSEEDILALIITGSLNSDLSSGGEYNISVGEGGEILSSAFGVTDELKNKTGINVKLKYSKTGDAISPEIEVGKKLSDDVRLIYGKSLDDDVNKQKINVQYDVNKNVELKLLLEEGSLDDDEEEPSNAGFDVRFKFEF
jgi:hypothetical protein